MRWAKLSLMALILCCLLIPITAQAADPVVVITVTARPAGGPDNFTFIYVSDSQIDLAWVNTPGTINTMVRAKYGEVPNDREDGYLVYLGAGESCSDTAYRLEDALSSDSPNPGVVYYKAWTETEAGWGNLFASGDTEGIMSESFLFIGLLFLAVSLTVSGFALKKSYLAFGATGAWFLVAVLAFTNAGETFDIYWGLFYLTSGLTIASAFVPLTFREAVGGEEEDLDPDMADLRHFREEQEKEQEQYGFLYGGRRRHNRPGRTLYRNPPRR
jgi:hypothetical protein